MTEEEVTTKWLDLEFYVYEHVNLGWSEVGGLYVFAGQRLDDSGILRWHPLYVGKTQDFSARLPTHERWPEAVQAGATHVHARTEPLAKKREALEKKLIEAYEPPLNVEHR